jgi:RpiR family carbohydrate utilization transcriptional regulator
MSERNVVIFISYTGRTREIVESAKIAHARGAITVGVTQNQSPLAEYCHFLLANETTENTDLFTPTTSRINHLAILDIIATAMALKLGDDLEDRIVNLKSSLNETRINHS